MRRRNKEATNEDGATIDEGGGRLADREAKRGGSRRWRGDDDRGPRKHAEKSQVGRSERTVENVERVDPTRADGTLLKKTKG